MTHPSPPRANQDLTALQQRAARRSSQHRQPVSGWSALAGQRSARAARPLAQTKRLPVRFLLHALVALFVPLAVVLSQVPLLQPRPEGPAAAGSLADALAQPAPLSLDMDPHGELPVPEAAFAEIDALPIDRLSPGLVNLRPPTANVIAEAATVRNGPGTNYDSIGSLTAGTSLRVLARFEDWYHAQQADGQLVWIAAELLDLNPTAASLLPDPVAIPAPPPPKVALVGDAQLNLRDGPGTNYIGMSKIGAGAPLDLLARYNDWLQVQTPDQAVGWVRADLLEIAPGVIERIEVVSAPPDPNPALVGAVRGSSVNLRGGPGAQYGKLSTLGGGVQLDLLGRHQDWLKVRTPKGAVGWVSRELVDIREFVARRVPVVNDIPALPKPQRATVSARPQAQPQPANNSAPAARPAPVSAGSSEIVAFALQFVGVPYVWGGASPKGFDCSGFTLYVYRKFGISLPHSAEGQFSSRYGTIISSQSDLRPGDLVFFVNTYKRGISHVGIYAGDGVVLQALTPGRGLAAVSMNSSYWSSRYYGGLRPGT